MLQKHEDKQDNLKLLLVPMLYSVLSWHLGPGAGQGGFYHLKLEGTK